MASKLLKMLIKFQATNNIAKSQTPDEAIESFYEWIDCTGAIIPYDIQDLIGSVDPVTNSDVTTGEIVPVLKHAMNHIG